MIKGCTKRVIVVKDIESNFFDEAFFIVKPQSTKHASKESDFINEAHRIVKSDLTNLPPCIEADTITSLASFKKSKPKLRDALMFVFGFGVSAVFCTFIYYSGILL